MGCFEVSQVARHSLSELHRVADTIGIGSPAVIEAIMNELSNAGVPFDKLAGHCHDTFNTGMVNTLTFVNLGVPSVDAAIGGTGGCPVS